MVSGVGVGSDSNGGHTEEVTGSISRCAQLIHDTEGEPGERAAPLVGLLADGHDMVVLTAARALQAMPSTPIRTDAIAGLARHRHPEALRIAGELLFPNASGPSTEDRPRT